MTEKNQTQNPPAPPTPPITNMTAPPATGKTEMVAPNAKPLRKMEILRDTEVFLPDAAKDPKGNLVPVVKVKGEIVYVSEEEALRLVNKKVDGTYGFTGERDGAYPKQVLRAARPWQPTREEVAKKDPLDPANFQEHVV